MSLAAIAGLALAGSANAVVIYSDDFSGNRVPGLAPNRLDAVRDALSGIGVQGLTVSEVRGFGRQKGQTEIYRGAEYTMQYVPKVKLELAIDDSSLIRT